MDEQKITEEAYLQFKNLQQKGALDGGKIPNQAVNYIQILIQVVAQSEQSTLQGVQRLIKNVGDYIIENATKDKILGNKSNLTLKSVSRIYSHYISAGLKQLGSGSGFDELKKSLIKISNDLMDIIKKSKSNILKLSKEFLTNGLTILLFSYSSVVAETLIQGAVDYGIKFQCVISESRPDCQGYKMYQQLTEKGIPCKMIVDSILGSALEKVDIVLCGAETVVENGGIINKAGTYTVALCAKSLKVPFYVISESYKFTRAFYPLQQSDIPEYLQQNDEVEILPNPYVSRCQASDQEPVKFFNPVCDYTPPELITLLVTDLGIIKPSAVTDELIQTFKA